MITLKYSDFHNRGFQEAMAALWFSNELDAQTSYRIYRMKQVGDKVFKEIESKRKKLIEEMALKDEEGKVIYENGIPKFSEEKQGEFAAKYNEMVNSGTVDVKINKIHYNDIKHVKGIPAAALESIRCFCDEIPEEIVI